MFLRIKSTVGHCLIQCVIKNLSFRIKVLTSHFNSNAFLLELLFAKFKF